MRRVAGVFAVAGLAALGGMAPSAQAVDTTVTFTLTAAGGLGVNAPVSVDLGSAATNAGSVSAQVGTVTVDDQRGLLAGSWTASVVSSDFTTGGATPEETIPAADVAYWSGPATAVSGTVVATPGQLTAAAAVVIDTSRTAFSATGIVGNNSASWDPTIVVTVPASAVVGTYSGTISHSVA